MNSHKQTYDSQEEYKDKPKPSYVTLTFLRASRKNSVEKRVNKNMTLSKLEHMAKNIPWTLETLLLKLLLISDNFLQSTYIFINI